jgi:two-component system OmpR family response regulator
MSGSLRILCAEDNEQMGAVLVRFLTRAGHVAIHARDGLEAWAILSGDLHAFDVLITDHQMPGMNGLQLAKLARQARFTGKILVHSASVTDKEAALYHACGVHRILPKTTAAPVLLQAIEAGGL